MAKDTVHAYEPRPPFSWRVRAMGPRLDLAKLIQRGSGISLGQLADEESLAMARTLRAD